MPNIQPNLPPGKDVRSGPSSAPFSTSSQNLQTKNSHNNGEIEKSKPSNIQPKLSNENNAADDTCPDNALAGLKINSNDDNNASPKKKNAKKKHRKQLHLATGLNGHPETSRSAHIPIAPGQNGSSHNFFVNQRGAVYPSTSPGSTIYASSSSRYLNNLSHHPQFQYMQSLQNAIDIQQALNTIAMHNNQHAASAPNTPLIHHFQRPASASIPCSPLTPQSNIQFFQNIMQHPLLSHTYATNVNNGVNMTTTPKTGKGKQSKNSPRHKKNNKNNENEANPEEKKFENYLSAEEVEQGLKNGTLFEGVLRINPKQFQHGFISTDDREEQDMFIDGVKNRNRSLQGDVVVVQLIESTGENETEEDVEKKQKRGKVVFIKEKVHTRMVIGNLKLMPDKSRQKALFVPRDHRAPRLNIPFSCWPDNFYQDAKKYEDTLFLAQIVEWFDTRFAMGKILSNIGQAGNLETESKAILAENDLDVTPFGIELRHLFPRLDYTIPEEEIKIREDCRKQCIFSIDPFNCRDIDDAISCKELENGNYEIGVHISDVAHYLTEDTILDAKVAQKATTVYLVEKAYHMLPDELCMLCSLFPGVDKLAFSVFWEITKDAQVLHHRFAKTVINSCAQLAYEHAQAILEDQEDAESDFPETYNGFEFKQIQKTIKIVGDIAAKFRKIRFDGGALRIDQPKVSFRLSTQNGLPESYWIYKIKESNQMIEEFMLLANMTVARRIYEDHPTLAFLRCHPPPSGHMMRILAKALKPLGIEIDISSAGNLHRSLLAHTGPDCLDTGKAMVLNMLCAKPMTRAKYFCAAGCEDDDFHHYALNVPLYTHFTSPIRRYADIMVHRYELVSYLNTATN